MRGDKAHGATFKVGGGLTSESKWRGGGLKTPFSQ